MAMLLDERSDSIARQHAQKVAVELLEMEIRLELWKAPAKQAEKLAAFEARYDAIVDRLHAKCVGMYRPMEAATAAPVPRKGGKQPNVATPAAEPRPETPPPAGPSSSVKDDPFA